MKSSISLFVVTSIFAMVLTGCGNTAEGIKEDATKDTKNAPDVAHSTGQKVGEGLKDVGDKVGEATKDAGKKVGEVAKETGDNLGLAGLTAQIKGAILANPITNSPGVSIDVIVTKESVTLKGYVAKPDQKDEADRISKEILSKAKATQTFTDSLAVVPETTDKPAPKQGN